MTLESYRYRPIALTRVGFYSRWFLLALVFTRVGFYSEPYMKTFSSLALVTTCHQRRLAFLHIYEHIKMIYLLTW